MVTSRNVFWIVYQHPIDTHSEFKNHYNDLRTFFTLVGPVIRARNCWRNNAQVTPFYTTNTLGEYICKPQNCSVTWAFIVTNATNRLNNRFHFSSYKHIVEIALSAQELIDCVGKEHGVTGKVCDGLPLVWVPNPSTRTVSPTVSFTTTPTRRRSAWLTSTTLLDTRSLLPTTSWVCSIWWWEDRDD